MIWASSNSTGASMPRAAASCATSARTSAAESINRNSTPCSPYARRAASNACVASCCAAQPLRCDKNATAFMSDK